MEVRQGIKSRNNCSCINNKKLFQNNSDNQRPLITHFWDIRFFPGASREPDCPEGIVTYKDVFSM